MGEKLETTKMKNPLRKKQHEKNTQHDSVLGAYNFDVNKRKPIVSLSAE